MSKPRVALAACLSLLLLLAPGPMRTAGAEKTLSLAQSNNAFGFALYGALREKNGRKQAGNLFFSPYSITSAFLMAREGAAGETAQQMDQVLHTAGLSDRGAAWQQLCEDLAAPTFKDGHGPDAPVRPAYEINIANAVWGQEGFAFEAPFTGLLDKAYAAPLRRIDFRDVEGARKAINDWAAKETRDKIKEVVPAGLPPPSTRMALANAIYFKAPWQDPFKKRLTKEDTFHGPGGAASKAPFMRRVGRFHHGTLHGVSMIEIPYKRNAASMVVFLPGEGADALEDFEKLFANGRFVGWRKSLTPTLVDLQFPRFTYRAFEDLTAVLPAMGMSLPFDAAKADFSRMTKQERLFIGAALHKSFVAVDEEGTEAAAVTVLMLKGGRAPEPEKPVEFKADRPFVFTIVHRATGAILFVGRVTQPTQ